MLHAAQCVLHVACWSILFVQGRLLKVSCSAKPDVACCTVHVACCRLRVARVLHAAGNTQRCNRCMELHARVQPACVLVAFSMALVARCTLHVACACCTSRAPRSPPFPAAGCICCVLHAPCCPLDVGCCRCMLHVVVVAFFMLPIACSKLGQVARRYFVLPAPRSLLRVAVWLVCNVILFRPVAIYIAHNGGMVRFTLHAACCLLHLSHCALHVVEA